MCKGCSAGAAAHSPYAPYLLHIMSYKKCTIILFNNSVLKRVCGSSSAGAAALTPASNPTPQSPIITVYSCLIDKSRSIILKDHFKWQNRND